MYASNKGKLAILLVFIQNCAYFLTHRFQIRIWITVFFVIKPLSFHSYYYTNLRTKLKKSLKNRWNFNVKGLTKTKRKKYFSGTGALSLYDTCNFPLTFLAYDICINWRYLSFG